MSGMAIHNTGLGLARGDLAKKIRIETLDRRPKFLTEKNA